MAVPIRELEERRRVERHRPGELVAPRRGQQRRRVNGQARGQDALRVGIEAVPAVVEELARHPQRRNGIPVHSQQVLSCRLARRNLRDVVEPLTDRLGAVGRRIDLQDVDAKAVQPILGNASHDPSILETAARIGRAAGQARHVVANEREEIPTVVAGLGEIALAFQVCWHPDALERGLRVQPGLVLLTPEEEEPGAVRIPSGQKHRSADGVANVAVIQGRNRLLRSPAVVDPRVGIEVVVPPEPVARSAERPSATLGDRADLRAGGSTVLGLVVRGQHLHFLNGIQAHLHHGAAVVARVHVRDTVDLDVVRVGPLPVRAESVGTWRGAGNGGGHYTWREQRESEEPAPVDGDVLDGLSLHGEGPFSGLHLQLGRVREDGDGLGDLPDFQHHDAERHAVAGMDDDAGPCQSLESRQPDAEHVGLRLDDRKGEIALLVGRDVQTGAARGADEGHACTRDDAALAVADRSGDRPAGDLRGGLARYDTEGEHQEKSTDSAR